MGNDNWVDNRGEAVDAMPAHILIEAEDYQALSAATVVAVQAGKTSEPSRVLSKVTQTRVAKHRQCLTFVCGDKEYRAGREAGKWT